MLSIFRADISELIWLFDVVTYLVFCFLSIPFFFHCSILPLRGSFSFSIHRWLIPQHRYASFKRLGILIYSFLFSVYFCFFFLLRHRFLFHFVEAINVNICRYYEADVCLNINTRSVCCCVSISRLSSLRLSIYIYAQCSTHVVVVCPFHISVSFFFLGSIQLSQFNFRFLNIGRLLASLNSSILQFSWALGFELFRHRFVPMSTIWMSTSYHYAPVHFSSLFLSLSLLPPIIHLFRSHTVYYPFMCVYTIFFLCLSFKYFLRNSVRHTYQTPNKQQQKVFMLFR